MNNIVEVVSNLAIVGTLFGIILEEKKHKSFWYLCIVIVMVFIVEISKEISIIGYTRCYINITIMYLVIFGIFILIGYFSNKYIKIRLRKGARKNDN